MIRCTYEMITTIINILISAVINISSLHIVNQFLCLVGVSKNLLS